MEGRAQGDVVRNGVDGQIWQKGKNNHWESSNGVSNSAYIR